MKALLRHQHFIVLCLKLNFLVDCKHHALCFVDELWVFERKGFMDDSTRIRWMTLPNGEVYEFEFYFKTDELTTLTDIIYAPNNYIYLSSDEYPAVIAKVCTCYNIIIKS